MKLFNKYINNRYFYTGLLFFVWLAFFDENNLIEQIRLSNKVNDLESREKFYRKEIEITNNEIKAFETDTALLEKFAREKYFIKKDKEDIFVIVRE
jgi:cell division protein FtsB